MRKRGSKPGAKRGPYKKHKPRLVSTSEKTTTKAGKKEYQRKYMKKYMRKKRGVKPDRFGKRGRKPKRTLLKDIEDDLKKLNSKLRGMD